jgi:hypothetical protein
MGPHNELTARRVAGALDVALGGRQLGVPGQLLDVAERAASRNDLFGQPCYESPPAGLARGAFETR